MKLIAKQILTFIFIAFISLGSIAQVQYTDQDFIITGLSGGGDFKNLAISPVDQNMMMASTLMTGVYLSTEGPYNWKMVHYSDLIYSMNAKACFHPVNKDIIYAPGDKGLKISKDRGNTWNPIGNIGRIEYGIAINPENTNQMLAGSGKSVWRSLDAGVNWEKTDGPAGNILGFHFDRNSAVNSWFAATSSGIWRSDDSGKTWVLKTSGLATGNINSFTGASNKKDNISILYCNVDNAFYRSNDFGESWTVLSSLSGKASYLLTSDVNPRIVWATAGRTNMQRSEDAGETWTPTYFSVNADPKFNVEPNYFTSYMDRNVGTSYFSAAIAPGNPDFVMFSTSMVCMFTDNGGKTWKSAHAKPVVKEGEPIPKSFLNTGLNNTTTWHYYVDPFEQNRQYIAYTDIGFARSVDAGKSWLFWPYWGPDKKIVFEWVFNLFEMAFDPEIPGKMWGAFSKAHDLPNSNSILRDHYTKLTDKEKKGGIAFSSDFAANWEDDGYNNGLPNRPTLSVILDPKSQKNSRTLYAAVYDEGVYKSTDDGHNWVKKSEGLGSASNMHVIRLQLHKDGTLFCLVTASYSARIFNTDGVGLFRSKNGGDSWEKVNIHNTFLWPRDFALDPDNSNEIYLGVHNANSEPGGLWKTSDGGLTWTALAQKGAHFGAYLHPSRQGWIYMTLCESNDATPGLWLSKDNGHTWIPFTKIPHRWIQRVDFDPKNPDVIYVSTFGASAIVAPADPDKTMR